MKSIYSEEWIYWIGKERKVRNLERCVCDCVFDLNFQ